MPVGEFVRRAAVIATAAGVMLGAAPRADAAGPYVFIASLSGAENVPKTSTSATGVGTILLNSAETQITVNCRFSGLTGNATGGEIRGPANTGATGDVAFNFGSGIPSSTSGAIPETTFAVTATQV